MFSYYTADGQLLSIQTSQPMISSPIRSHHIPESLQLYEHFAVSSQDTVVEIDPYVLRIQQLIKDKLWKEKVQEVIKKIVSYSETNEKDLKQFKDSINNIKDVIAAKNIKPVKDTPDIIVDEPVDPVDKATMERNKKEEEESKKTEMQQKINMIGNTKTTMKDRIKLFEDHYAEESNKFQDNINTMNYIQGEIRGVISYIDGLGSTIKTNQEQMSTVQAEIDRDAVAYANKPPPNMTYAEAQLSLTMRRAQVDLYQKRIDTTQNVINSFSMYMSDIDEMKKLFEQGNASIQKAPAIQKELMETVPQVKALLLQV